MSRIVSQTLIKTTSSAATIFSNPIAIRRISFQAGSISYVDTRDGSSMSDASVAEKIDDAIHGVIVERSKPYWLPFVPGSSYWVPPRKSSYGAAKIIEQLRNPVNQDQQMAVLSLQGWPSSAFYLDNGVPAEVDPVNGETPPAQFDVVNGETPPSATDEST